MVIDLKGMVRWHRTTYTKGSSTQTGHGKDVLPGDFEPLDAKLEQLAEEGVFMWCLVIWRPTMARPSVEGQHLGEYGDA